MKEWNEHTGKRYRWYDSSPQDEPAFAVRACAANGPIVGSGYLLRQ